MSLVKKIVAGAIIAGGGFALEKIGELIFAATGGATSGPVVNYQVLIQLSSTALIFLGGAVALYGLLEGVYRAWKSREDEGEEKTTSSRSRTPPSSQRDRPRSPPRS